MRSFEAWTGILLAGLLLSGGMVAAMQGAATTTDGAMPRYDGEGNLLLPDDYKEWRFVGSSLGLSYTEGPPGGEMFHHTLMEPTAYDHFTRTGEFREGTMFVLLLHGTGEGEIPQRRGRFAAETDLDGTVRVDLETCRRPLLPSGESADLPDGVQGNEPLGVACARDPGARASPSPPVRRAGTDRSIR
jgi:hypothetical protein